MQDEEPWQLAKDERRRSGSTRCSTRLAEGLRVVSVLLHPFMPASAERLLAALGQPELSLDDARLGRRAAAARRLGELGQLFPRVEAEAPAA